LKIVQFEKSVQKSKNENEKSENENQNRKNKNKKQKTRKLIKTSLDTKPARNPIKISVLLFLSRLRNSLWLSRILDH
jgi:hypothetical protein